MFYYKNYAILREVELFYCIISEVDKYKYLGIIFSSANDVFAENIQYLRDKAL